MIKQGAASVQMIPIDQIHVLNPRVRNAKLFDSMVQNMINVGLKRPITVMSSRSRIEGKDYDLVCGQGRLEAFMVCGQKMIPAIVINASEEQALIMSLVENCARRKHKPMELLQGVEILRKQGYNVKTIASKIGHSFDYTNSIVTLLERGEEKLLTAVEFGHIPITLAINIACSPKREQEALQKAYETGALTGQKLIMAKNLLDERKNCGKTVRGPKKKSEENDPTKLSQEIIKTYRREVSRKQLLERKADMVNTRLVFLTEAMYCLMQEDHFTTLLRAEHLDTMPRQLADLISAKGN